MVGARSILLVGFAFVVCGCGRVVHVVDEKGVPVAGAHVERISLSYNGPVSVTDKDGIARLAAGGQKAVWVNVSKAGYEKAHMDLPEDGVIQVQLKAVKK